jgi:hypothetical protein
MFYGSDLDSVLFQTGAHAGVADQKSICANVHRFRQIDAAEDDTRIRGSRAQGHVDLDTAVEADARGADDSLERALL